LSRLTPAATISSESNQRNELWLEIDQPGTEPIMKHQTNIARGLLAALLLVQIALAATAAESPAVANTSAATNPPVRDAATTAAPGAHLDYAPGQPPRFWSVAAADTVMARWPDFSKAYFNTAGLM
jgi:hypothetical protein